MNSPTNFIIECQNPDCRFRFPVAGRKVAVCPVCREVVLEIIPVHPAPAGGLASIPVSPFCGVLLDNIRSIFNVGSIFRTADGLALDHLYLCGITATPEHPRLAKTALGAQYSTAWSYQRNGLDAALALVNRGFQVWALEGGPGAASLFDVKTLPATPKIILAVGNEITGVDPHILKLCSRVVYLPMQGVKESLNVAVAFGIAAYTLRFTRVIP